MVYIIMYEGNIFENAFYTEESVVSKRVEYLRENYGPQYWYKTLIKN